MASTSEFNSQKVTAEGSEMREILEEAMTGRGETSASDQEDALTVGKMDIWPETVKSVL